MPEDALASVGSTKRFECRVIGYPTPRISWLKDDIDVSRSDRFKFDYSTDGYVTMEIENVTYSDVGSYQCLAVNSEGWASTTAHLKVKGIGTDNIDDTMAVHRMTFDKSGPRKDSTKRPLIFEESTENAMNGGISITDAFDRTKLSNGIRQIDITDTFDDKFNITDGSIERCVFEKEQNLNSMSPKARFGPNKDTNVSEDNTICWDPQLNKNTSFVEGKNSTNDVNDSTGREIRPSTDKDFDEVDSGHFSSVSSISKKETSDSKNMNGQIIISITDEDNEIHDTDNDVIIDDLIGYLKADDKDGRERRLTGDSGIADDDYSSLSSEEDLDNTGHKRRKSSTRHGAKNQRSDKNSELEHKIEKDGTQIGNDRCNVKAAPSKLDESGKTEEVISFQNGIPQTELFNQVKDESINDNAIQKLKSPSQPNNAVDTNDNNFDITSRDVSSAKTEEPKNGLNDESIERFNDSSFSPAVNDPNLVPAFSMGNIKDSDSDEFAEDMFHSDEEERHIIDEIRPNIRLKKLIQDETKSNSLSFQSMESWSLYESCDDYTLSESNFDTISYQKFDDGEFLLDKRDDISRKDKADTKNKEKFPDKVKNDHNELGNKSRGDSLADSGLNNGQNEEMKSQVSRTTGADEDEHIESGVNREIVPTAKEKNQEVLNFDQISCKDGINADKSENAQSRKGSTDEDKNKTGDVIDGYGTNKLKNNTISEDKKSKIIAAEQMLNSDEEELEILAEILPHIRLQRLIHDETKSNTLSFQSAESWSVYESGDDYSLSESAFDTFSYQNVDDDEFLLDKRDDISRKDKADTKNKEKFPDKVKNDNNHLGNKSQEDSLADSGPNNDENEEMKSQVSRTTSTDDDEHIESDVNREIVPTAKEKNQEVLNFDKILCKDGITADKSENAQSRNGSTDKDKNKTGDVIDGYGTYKLKNKTLSENKKSKTIAAEQMLNSDEEELEILAEILPHIRLQRLIHDETKSNTLSFQSAESWSVYESGDDYSLSESAFDTISYQNIENEGCANPNSDLGNDEHAIEEKRISDNGSTDKNGVSHDAKSAKCKNGDRDPTNKTLGTNTKVTDKIEEQMKAMVSKDEGRRQKEGTQLQTPDNKVYYSSDEYVDDESDVSVEEIEMERSDILRKLDLSSYVIDDPGRMKLLSALREISSPDSSDFSENDNEINRQTNDDNSEAKPRNTKLEKNKSGVNENKENSESNRPFKKSIKGLNKLEHLHSMGAYADFDDESESLKNLSDTKPALPNTFFLGDNHFSLDSIMERIASETNPQLQSPPEFDEGEFDDFVNLLTVVPGKEGRALLSPIVEEGTISRTSESVDTTMSSPEEVSKDITSKKSKRPSLIDLTITNTDGVVEPIDLEKIDSLQSFANPQFGMTQEECKEQDGMPRIIKGPSSVTAMNGCEIVLQWTITGYPEPEVAVFKDGDSLQFCDGITLEREDTSWTLRILDVIKEDAGLYEICAVNSIGNDILKTRVYVKNVERLPPENDSKREAEQTVVPEFLISPKDQEVNRGQVIHVECHILGDPQIVWLKDNEPIYPNEQVEILQEETKFQLVIKAAVPDDSGKYMCRASNSVGVNQVQFAVDVLNKEDGTDVDNTENRDNVPNWTWKSGYDQDKTDRPLAPVVQLDMSESDECFSRKYQMVSDYHDEFNEVDLTKGEITEVLDRSKESHWLVKSLKDQSKICYVPPYLLENTNDSGTSAMSPGQHGVQIPVAEIQNKKKKVLKELIESETDYICDLKDLLDTYMLPVDEGKLSQTFVDKQSGILNTLNQLYQFHKDTLLPSLLSNSEEAEHVGEVFSEKRGSFSEYVPFCSEHDKTMDTTDIDQMQALMEAMSLIMGDPDAAFEDLLNRPLERIHEYIDILKTLIKLTAQSGGDCSGLMAAVQMLTEICRNMEDIVLLDRIQGYHGDVKELGPVLKHENVMQVEKEKKGLPEVCEGQRHVILFEDKIMVTMPTDSNPKGKLEFEKIIDLKDVSVGKQDETDGTCTIELWEGKSSELSATPSLKLQVQDFHAKEAWVRDIREAKKKLEVKNTLTDTMPEFRQKLKGKKLTSTPKKKVVKNVDTVELESDRSSDDFNILGTRKDLVGDRYIAAEFEDGTTRPLFRRKLQKTIVGENSTSQLECEVAGIPQPKVLWLKNNRPLVESDHCKVVSDGSVHRLEFTDTRREDTGLYTARAMNVNGSTISTAELYVGDVQPNVLNKYKEGLSDTKYQTPAYFFQMNSCQVEEGRLARFDCRVVAYPKPDIVWMKDGKVVEPNDRYKLLNFNNEIYSLLIQNVIQDDMGRYTCWAHNMYGEAMTEAYLNVIAFQDQQEEGDIAPRFLTRFYDQTLTEGVPAELQCLIEGRPMPTIKWLYNDIELISNDNVAILQDKNLLSLCIKEVTPTDLGTYTCNLKNALGDASCSAGLNVLSDKIKNVPVLPKFLKRVGDQNVRTGEEVTFEVVVIGEPPPKVMWLFNHKPISGARRRFKMTQDGDVYRLTIDELILDDDGKITCKAVNSEGEVYSSGNLLVREARKMSEQSDEPKFTQKDFDAKYGYLPTFMKKIEDISVPSGKDGKFECRIMGIPEPTVSWKKNGNPITNDSHHWMSQDGGNCYLTVRGVADRDQGVYTCTIANAAGEASCTAYMRLAEAKKPGEYFEGDAGLMPGRRGSLGKGEVPTMPYEKPTISDIRPESSRVTWQPVLTSALSPDSKNIKYFIEGRELPDGDWRKMASGIHGNTHLLRNLRPQKEYDFRVRAENQFGLSDATQPATLERPKPEVDEFAESMKSRLPQFKRPPELPKSRPYIADMGAESVKLSWQPAALPSFTKKQPPVSYRLEAQELPASDWLPLSSRLSDTSHYLTDLLHDRDYNIRVRAENKYGLSEPTEPIWLPRAKAFPGVPVARPEIIEMEPNMVKLRWERVDIPSFSSGDESLMYMIEMQQPPARDWTSVAKNVAGTVYVVSDLEPGQDYKFRVRARTPRGVVSEPSPVTSLYRTIATSVAPIDSFELEDQDVDFDGIRLRWNRVEVPPYTAGDESLLYMIEVNEPPLDEWRPVVSGLPTTRYRVTDLTPDRDYHFRVRALSSYGVSPPSYTLPVSYRRPLPGPSRILPEYPQIVYDETDALQLSWQPLKVSTPIKEPIKYRVELQAPPSLAWKPLATGIPDTRYPIRGLGPSRDYMFRVVPETSTGLLEPLPPVSLTSLPAPRTFLPSRPEILDYEPDSFMLSWRRPYVDTHLPLMYRVDMQEPPSLDWRPLVSDVTDTRYRVTGLRPSRDYSFRIVPYTGTDHWEPLPPVTLTSLPVKPRFRPHEPTLTPLGSDSLKLSWKPADLPMYPRTPVPINYIVDMRTLPSYDWTPMARNVMDTSYTIKGLSVDKEYQFRVRPQTSYGIGEPTMPVTFYRKPVPFVSREPVISNIYGDSVLLSWQPANFKGDFKYPPPVSYSIETQDRPGTGPWTPLISGIHGTNYHVTGLHPDREYFFRVRGHVGDVLGEPSAPVYLTHRAGPPRMPQEQPYISELSPNSVHLQWRAVQLPSRITDYAPVSYRLEIQELPRSDWVVLADGIPHTDFHVTNLHPDKEYNFRVRAVNKYGCSEPTSLVQIRRRAVPPKMPKEEPMIYDIGHGSLMLSWRPAEIPHYLGDSPVTYTIYVQDPPSMTWRPLYRRIPYTSYHVTNLQPDRDYCFRVQAENIYGLSQPTNAVRLTRLSDFRSPIDIPEITDFDETRSSLQLRWKPRLVAPFDKGQLKYHIESWEPIKRTWRRLAGDIPDTSYRLTGLSPENDYILRVRAQAESVLSDPSYSVSTSRYRVKTPITRPQLYDVEPDSVRLSWQPYPGVSVPRRYKLELRESTAKDWRPVTTDVYGTTHKVTGLKPKQDYEFRVRGITEKGPTDYVYSVPLHRRSVVPRLPLAGVDVVGVEDDYVDLNWRMVDIPAFSPDDKPLAFLIEAQQLPRYDWVPVASGISDTRYRVKGLQRNQDYTFRIRGEYPSGLSQPSQHVSVYRRPIRPGVPITRPEILDEEPGSARLRWKRVYTPPYHNFNEPLSYHIESQEAPYHNWRTLARGVTMTEHPVSDLMPKRDYLFRIRAETPNGDISDPTPPISYYKSKMNGVDDENQNIEMNDISTTKSIGSDIDNLPKDKISQKTDNNYDYHDYRALDSNKNVYQKDDRMQTKKSIFDKFDDEFYMPSARNKSGRTKENDVFGLENSSYTKGFERPVNSSYSKSLFEGPENSNYTKPLFERPENSSYTKAFERPENSRYTKSLFEGPENSDYTKPLFQRPENSSYTKALERPENSRYTKSLFEGPENSDYTKPLFQRPENSSYTKALERPENSRYTKSMFERPENSNYSKALFERPENSSYTKGSFERPKKSSYTKALFKDYIPSKSDFSDSSDSFDEEVPSPRIPRKTVDYKVIEQDFSVPTRSYVDHLTTFIPPRLPLDKPEMIEEGPSTVSLRWRPALIPDRTRDKYPVTYSIEAKNPPNLEWRDLESGLTGLSHTCKNIHPEIDYMFRIRAHNEFGSSEATLPVSLYRPIELEPFSDEEDDYEYPLVTLGDCEAPIEEVPPKLPMETPKLTNISGERGMLHWLPARIPAYAKKVPITYIVEIKEDNMPCFSRFQSGLTDTKFYIEGLNPSQSYQFRVVAETKFGCSDPTLAVVLERNKEDDDTTLKLEDARNLIETMQDKIKRPSIDIKRDDLDLPQTKMREVVPQGVPPRMSSSRPLITNRYGGSLSLTWGPARVPSYVKGSSFKYIVEKREPPQTNWTILADNLPDNEYDVDGLSQDRDYLFRVRAKNQFGTSEPTMPCSIINIKDEYVPPVFSRSQSRDSGTPRILSRRSSIESPLSLSRQMSLDENDDMYRTAMPPEFKSSIQETQYGVLGKTAKITLAVRGFPLPVIEWTFKGENLTNKKKHKSFITPSGVITLEIFNFCLEDVGEYKCRAENDHGIKSIIIDLEHADAPTFIDPTQDLYLDNHRKGNFECKVEGVPYPTIRWMKDWRPVTESSRLKIHHTKPNHWSLSLSDVISLDGGMYTCVAENVAGKSMCSANLFVDDDSDNEELETTTRPVTFRQTVFEDYFYVLEELGRGRHGIVRKVIEKSTGKEYAAKIIPACNEELKYFFGHELNNLRCLSNPRVPSVVDAFQSERQLVIVMDLVEGRSLVDHIFCRDKWCETDVVFYIKQLLEILRNLHASSIVHLDIKPSNIHLSEPDSDQIRLLDFGLSRHLSMDYDIKFNYGTEEFTSPEQISNEPVSTATDMWSVGILTYILLSGVSPLKGDNDSETLKKILEGKINLSEPNFKIVSEDAKDFLAELLVVDPSERLTAAECLHHPWIKDPSEKSTGQLDLGELKSFQARDAAQRKATSIKSLPRLNNLTSVLQQSIPVTPFTLTKDDQSGDLTFPESEYFGQYLDEESWYDWQNRFHKSPGSKVVQLSETDYLARVRGSRPIRRVTDIDDEDTDVTRKMSIMEEEENVHDDSCLRKELQYVVVADDVKQRKQASKDFFPKEDIKDENPQILSKFHDMAFNSGDDIILTFNLEISETPAVSWYRNEELISEGNRIGIKISKTGTTLTIISTKPYDEGIYKCVVRSKGGKATAAARVLVGDVPNQPSRPVATKISSNQVVFLWEPPTSNGNSHVLGYRVDYRKTHESSWLTGSFPIDECTIISDLLPDTSYRVRVCAVNQFGSSPYSVASAEIRTAPSGDDEIHIDEYTSAILARQQCGMNLLPTPPARRLIQLTEGSFSDKYQLTETLYRGKFSELKVAESISTGRSFAAKIISCDKDKDSAKNEFDILRLMNHEKIVRLYDVFLFNEKLYIIMEYLCGVNVLQHFSFKTKYTEDMVAIVIRQVLEGIQFLQHVGVIHLNLQPSSIVMRSRRHLQLKITGFSHARKVVGSGEIVPCVGYPDFISPEVVTREITTYSADIWTVGVLCFVLLSGESPFRAPTVEETYSNIAYNRYDAHDLYENITRDALRFINRILKRIPRNRMTVEDCLEDKWVQVADTTVKARQEAIFTTAKLRSFADLYRKRGILGIWMPKEIPDLIDEIPVEEPVQEETKEPVEGMSQEADTKISEQNPETGTEEETKVSEQKDETETSVQKIEPETSKQEVEDVKTSEQEAADMETSPVLSTEEIVDKMADSLVTGAIEQALDSEEFK